MYAPYASVVVPVLNAAGSIRVCVESLLRLRPIDGPIELICVDNGSTDATLRILESFGPAITIVAESTRGPAAARNAGLRRATGTFIAFCDADCTVSPDWLSSLLEPMRLRTASATGGRILARPQARAIERFGELIHDHCNAIECDRPPYLIGMNMACRRDLLLALGGFDERWIRMEDVEIAYRFAEAGLRLVYCHDAVVHHHNRDTVPGLVREAFLHGWYQPSFRRVHANFVRRYRERIETAPHVSTASHAPAPTLERWQIGLLWKLFESAKSAGRFYGSWFPPRHTL